MPVQAQTETTQWRISRPADLVDQVPERSGDSRKHRTEKETKARKMLRLREGDVEHGIPVNPKIGRISFEDAADDILNDYRANERTSLSGLERRITKHLNPFFKGRRLASVTIADVRASIAKRKADVIETGTGDEKKARPVSNRGDQPRADRAQAHVFARDRIRKAAASAAHPDA
jgi:hypothetical protein